MSEDLITGNFTDGIDKSIITKTHTIFKIIFLLFLAYTIFDIFDWYMLFNAVRKTPETLQTLFYYKLRPIISRLIVLGNLIIIQSYITANKLIAKSIEEESNYFFNKGYIFFYKSALLTLIVGVLSVLSIVTRLLLINR